MKKKIIKTSVESYKKTFKKIFTCIDIIYTVNGNNYLLIEKK